ncbi:MAG: hypothetical protein K2V38_22485 [Gemmataceae bacterium]|nr:hypothetical protein [Gemmataceae bacterium]
MLRKFLFALAVAAFAPAAAQATFQVTLTVGAQSITIVDGNTTTFNATSSYDFDSNANGINLSPQLLQLSGAPGAAVSATSNTTNVGQGVSIGGYRVALATSVGPSVFGLGLLYNTQTTLAIRNEGGVATSTPLIITITDPTGYTAPGSVGDVYQLRTGLTGLQINNFANVTVSSNVASPSTSTPGISVSGGPGSTPASTVATATYTRSSAVFNLTQIIRVDSLGANGGITMGVTTDLIVAPAPAGLVLLATALPVVGLARRFRKA